MKIGYDAKRAFLNSTGLGNYSRWLIKGMLEYQPQNFYILYTPNTKADNFFSFLNFFDNLSIVLPKAKFFASLWRSSLIIKKLQRDGVNIYHGLSHELPFGIHKSGIYSVVTVHDLIFMRFPEYFGWINRKIYLAKLSYACRVADKIIAISYRTKNDLVELLKVNKDKIEVIYQGCDPIFKVLHNTDQKKQVRDKYKLPERFILNVGTIETRKNLLLVIKSLPLLKNQIPLVVVGRPTKYLEEIQTYINANQLAKRIMFLKDVEFTDLPSIYQLASLFVYPSRYEGFGIPILEALNSGVPVIAAKGSCLEEAGGPNSIYVNPDDEHDIATQIDFVLNNKELGKTMIEKGYQYASNFEDGKLAGQLNNLYKRTLIYA